MDDVDYVYDYENDDGNYSGGGGGISDDEDALEENHTVDEFGETWSQEPKQNYRVLNEEEIVQLQEDEIARAFTVLSISKADACLLLPHFNWNVEKLQDGWFADEDEVREKVGLVKEPLPVQFNVPRKNKNTKKHAVGQFNSGSGVITCAICFDDCASGSMFSAGCGHLFCRGCWEGYVSTSIIEGPACLMLSCPEPSCKAAVDPDLISILATKRGYKRYKRYLVRSYVEEHRKIKWCPAPNCEYAVQFDADGTANYDVSCLCSNSFCWNCTEEIHRPVDCGTVAKWILKNKDESQNAQWILVNTKCCPKCKRTIEKNQGCNHMVCRAPCKFQFCWLCLRDWSKGHCNCHSYPPTKVDGAGPLEKEKMKVKRYLDRYIHYYERWANNKSSKQKALEDFHQVQTVHIQKLASIRDEPDFKFNFLIDAWQQIIECRQVLRWTYVYGYYIPEDEHAKAQLFEHLQGHAEFSLERLHQCAEKDLEQFLLAIVPLEKFEDFRLKLVKLTKVTGNYFKKLVTALENGLSEVNI